MSNPHGGSPIGVFDSGIGGLSVLAALQRCMPRENFVYLGDVARLPYGTKSNAVVTRYASHCLSFLLAQSVKAVVIACNTASAMALETLREVSPVPIYGVIEPGVAAGCSTSRTRRILVLATEAAVRSEAYLREFGRQCPEAVVEQVACPLLVPLAEEGWFHHPVTIEVIRAYLSRARGAYDTIVLGCTHYPLLEDSFRQVLGSEVRLVHGATQLAPRLREDLRTSNLENGAKRAGELRLYSTDRISPRLPLLEALFSSGLNFETVDL